MVQVKLFVASILAAAAITLVVAAPVKNVRSKGPKKSTPPTPDKARVENKRSVLSRLSFEERGQKLQKMMDDAAARGSIPESPPHFTSFEERRQNLEKMMGSKSAYHPPISSSSWVQPEIHQVHQGQGTPGSMVTEHSQAPSSSSSSVQHENHQVHQGQGTPGSTVTEHSQAPSSSSSSVQHENHQGQGTPGSTVTEHSQAPSSNVQLSSSSSVQHENHQGQGTPGSTVTEHSQAPSSSSVQPENAFNQGHWQGTHWLAQSNFVRKT